MHKISCKQNRFRCTSVHLGNHAHKRADVQVTNNNMIGSRNCTKLVLKPLSTKNGLSISVLCIASFCRLYYFSLHDDYPLFLCTVQSIHIAALHF